MLELALRGRTGVVSALAVLSMAVCSAIAFLVAGGTWMFWQRAQHVEDASPALHEYLERYGGVLDFWLYLAVFACAFLVPAVFNLTAQSAVLGASGRERRLATLRLLGLSSRQVVRLAVVETAVQSVVGIGLGCAASVLAAPLFTHLSFQDRPIRLSEILLPWWGYLAVAGVLFALSVAAAFAGMQRVRVSPLGVARREMPKALRWWRLAVFVAAVVVGGVVLSGFSITGETIGVLFMLGILATLVLLINLVAPFLLQVGAYLAALLPGAAHLVACQRIGANARVAWRRVGAIAFFGFLAGYLVAAPLGEDGLTLAMREEATTLIIFTDVSTGALLTLAFGFILAAMSIFLGQVSAVYEDANLHRSLSLMGLPRGFLTRVSALEVMGPAIALSLFGFAFGALMVTVMFDNAGDIDLGHRIATALSILAVGWVVSAGAVLAAEPLRSRVLRQGVRRE
ncbi:FtsX-like permease family protein [Corynebacterium lizhenjunii]|uniref:FtsX-like permease family protein n=1 Tax=Corynebacterium lizhenjunii TaxID=2709394 RepID=UPI0013EBE535|nr:FtsX-like permease family protein [Corynebacterium lizhenjunii]